MCCSHVLYVLLCLLVMLCSFIQLHVLDFMSIYSFGSCCFIIHYVMFIGRVHEDDADACFEVDIQTTMSENATPR